MLFADLVIPAGVLIILVGVVLIAVGIFVNARLCESSLSPVFDPFAMILMAILLIGGVGLIFLGVGTWFFP